MRLRKIIKQACAGFIKAIPQQQQQHQPQQMLFTNVHIRNSRADCLSAHVMTFGLLLHAA